MSVRAEAQPHPGTLQLIPQEALAGATAMQQSPPSVAEQGELHEANSAQLEESNLTQPVFSLSLCSLCAAYQTASADHPLSRTVVVTIRASLNDLWCALSKCFSVPTSLSRAIVAAV